jgi:hypothetical protein
MTFVFLLALLVCFALYFYSAAQAAHAVSTSFDALFAVDKIIARFAKTAGSFFFVRFVLVGIVTYPTQLIYNAGMKTSENSAALYALLYVGALSVLFLLLALRNRRKFGAQAL